MSRQRQIADHDIQDHPDNETDTEDATKKLKYPKSVFFIVSNEFCERFSYYGMRTVLTLYFRNQLNYDDNSATVIYHVFAMFAYFFPVLGGILADSWLGKFRTIFYLSIIYAIGLVILSLSAAPPVGIPPREFSIVGLLLIALGTGGIKPCVAAFGGDQFILPQQERYLAMFFSLFYFSINSGSLISTFLTPVLRSSVTCFGQDSCYSLAFFVPAVLMTLSIVIFVAGKPMYRMVKPSGNVVVDVSKCVSHAIYNKATSKGVKKDHWLDHADDKYDKNLISDVKAAMQVLKLFLPLPIFWALYDQQGSRWTIQATRMNGELGSYLIQPDQMQVVNPLLILIFIPLFETVIYPLLAKINIQTPLKKLTVGGFLAALAFVASAILELQLEKTYPILPSEGLAQVRLFNTLNCPISLTINGKDSTLEKLNVWKDINIKANGEIELPYVADFSICDQDGYTNGLGKVTGNMKGKENTATTWIVTPSGISDSYVDSIDKSKTGNPSIRPLLYVDPALPGQISTLKFVKNGENILRYEIKADSFKEILPLKDIKPDTYNIYIDDKKVQSNVPLKLGGVYTIVGFDVASANVSNKRDANAITVTEPNSVHILWLIPQYVIITMGEVMFSVTGLEFAFTQAPITMKSLLQASWLLAVAFGNLIVVIIAEVSIFKRQVLEFFLFAGLMVIDIIIFAIMSKFYKYVEVPDDETIAEDINMEEKNGTVNPSYKDDEK